MPAEDSRRFLIAAGTEHYDDGDELASVPEDLRKMVGFFGGLGYREQLPEVRLDPTSPALRSELSDWLTGSDRQASDTAVIYYSGHGTSRQIPSICSRPTARKTSMRPPLCPPTMSLECSAKTPGCAGCC